MIAARQKRRRRLGPSRLAAGALCLSATLLAGACATSPTGRSQLHLIPAAQMAKLAQKMLLTDFKHDSLRYFSVPMHYIFVNNGEVVTQVCKN